MSEGHDWTRPPIVKRSFRVNGWQVFLKVFCVFLALGMIPMAGMITYWSLKDGILVDARIWADPILDVLIYCLLIATFESLILLIYRVDVTPTTLSSLNFWSVRKQILINDIALVDRPVWTLGLFFLVHSSHGTVLWIPLQCSDNASFAETVWQVSPQDNPLAVFLRKRASRQSRRS